MSEWCTPESGGAIFVVPARQSVGMNDHRDSQLARRAELQHGVFTRDDALDIGIPESTLSDGVATGRYRSLMPGVYAIGGSPQSLTQRLAAAVKSMPALAALSHRTAAELWGLTERGIRTIDIVTSRWDRVQREDVVVHESLDLIEQDVTTLRGLAVTTAVRTIVDLGATSRWAVEAAFEAGIRKDLFNPADVEAMVLRVARRGRRGVGAIRPVLEARRHWDSATESALEDLFRRVVDDVGLPRPRSQYVVKDAANEFVCRADFAYPEARLLIELDSEAHHMDRVTFRRDRAKQNRATVLGWTVLRYTWWDLQDNPYHAGAEIAAALRASRPA